MITLHVFKSKTCGPCKGMEPILAKIETYDDVLVSYTDIANNMQMALHHDVRGVPTFLIFKDGMEIDRKVGARSENDFEGWLNEYREVQSDVFSESSDGGSESGTPLLCSTGEQENTDS